MGMVVVVVVVATLKVTQSIKYVREKEEKSCN